MHDALMLPSRVTRLAPAALLGLVLTAPAGCGKATLPADPPDAGPIDAAPADLPLAHSFEMRAALTYMDSGFPMPPDLIPLEHEFLLRLEDAGPITRATAAVGGQTGAGQLTRLPGGQRELTQWLFLPAGGDIALCGFGNIIYETMVLDTYDTDGDGSADRVQGRATGNIGTSNIFFFTATITGTLDTTPPRLTVRGPVSDRSVLGDVIVEASEPLRRASGMIMTSTATGQQVALDPLPELAMTISAFAVPPDLPLAFGDTLQLGVFPAIEDLAGNAAIVETPTFTTAADPQLFPQDGFESGAGVAISGDAALVPSVGLLPVLSGATSLLLGPDSTVMLRLPLPADGSASAIGLTLRGLFRDPGEWSIDGEIALASPGASQPVIASFPNATATEATGDLVWSHAGTISGMNVPPPGGGAGEIRVVLRMGPSPSSCDGGQRSGSAVLVDDVVVLSNVTDPPQPLSVPAAR